MMITLFSGLIFFIAGLILHRFPPGKINALYGYRTNRSMKDQTTWDLAQQLSSKAMMKVGLVLCLIGLLDFLFSWSGNYGFVMELVLLILAVVVMIVRVERRLKEFQDGR